MYAGLARCDPHLPIIVLYDSRASEDGGDVGTDCEFYGIVSSLLLSISEKGFPFVDPTLDPRKLARQLISLELNVKGLTDQASKCAMRTTVVELTEAFRARGLLEWADFNGVRLPFTPAPRGTFDSMLTVPLKGIAEKFQAQMRLEPEDVSAEMKSSFESIAEKEMVAVCERLVDDRSSKTQPHLPCRVLDTHAKPMCFEKGCEEQAVTLVAVTSLDAGVLARAAELRGVMWTRAGRRAALRAGLLKSLRTTTSFEGYKQLFLSTLLELGHRRVLEYYQHDITLLQPAPRPAGPESYVEDSATDWKERPLVDSDGEARDPMQQVVCWYDACAECWREGLVVCRNQSSTLLVVPCSLMELLPSEGKPPRLLFQGRPQDSHAAVCFDPRASTDWHFSGPELLRRPKCRDRKPGGKPMFFDRLRGWRLVSMETPPTLNDQEITDLTTIDHRLWYACALRGSPDKSSLGGADVQRSWLRAHCKTQQWQQQQQQQQQQVAESGTAGEQQQAAESRTAGAACSTAYSMAGRGGRQRKRPL